MSICIAVLTNDSERMELALRPYEEALVFESTAAFGWGMAYVHSGQFLLKKVPLAKHGHIDFGAIGKGLRTSFWVAAAGDEPECRRAPENTQPLRYGNWVYCQSGVLPNFAAWREAALRALPPFLVHGMKGRSSAEFCFALFLNELKQRTRLDKEGIDPRVAADAMTAADKKAQELLQAAGQKAAPRCCIATNGKLLIARHDQSALAIARHTGYEAYEQDIPKSRRKYGHLKTVTVVGGKDAGIAGSEAVPEATTVVVEKDLSIRLFEA